MPKTESIIALPSSKPHHPDPPPFPTLCSPLQSLPMDKFMVLRKILKAIGLSEERINELIATIESWLSDDKETPTSPQFPYRLRDDFLSPAEQSFFLVLKATDGLTA